MNLKAIDDLIDHASNQICDTINRTADLLEDESSRDVFMVTLFSRFLTHTACAVYDEGEGGRVTPEALITTALVLGAFIYGKPAIEGLDQARMGRRAQALVLKLSKAGEAAIRP